MNRTYLPILLLACLTVTAGCSFLGPNSDSYTSTYEYTVGVDSNATIRVPFAQVNDTTATNASAIAPDGTVEDSFDATVVETDYGPMLELTTEELRVEPAITGSWKKAIKDDVRRYPGRSTIHRIRITRKCHSELPASASRCTPSPRLKPGPQSGQNQRITPVRR